MWDNVRGWLNDQLPVQLPADEELFDELIGIEKKFDGRGRLQLQDKEEVKKVLGRSPDKADALALTLAEPVYDNGVPKLYGNGRVTAEQLFADANRNRKRSYEW